MSRAECRCTARSPPTINAISRPRRRALDISWNMCSASLAGFRAIFDAAEGPATERLQFDQRRRGDCIERLWLPSQQHHALQKRELALGLFGNLDIVNCEMAILQVNAKVVQSKERVIDRRHQAKTSRHAMQELEPGSSVQHNLTGRSKTSEECPVRMAEHEGRDLVVPFEDFLCPFKVWRFR